MPALIFGNTVHRFDGEKWVRRAFGGRLFSADGLWSLEYGPSDIILLDGNFAHGITALKSLPGAGHVKGRKQMERFSIIMFNKFQREAMKDGLNYVPLWRAVWRDAVPWKVGCEPVKVDRATKRGKIARSDDFVW